MTAASPELPLPRWTGSAVVVDPPGGGPGAWAGAPTAVPAEGGIVLAYRLRRPIGEGRGYANVVATSADGVTFSTVATLSKDRFSAESLERPAIVRGPEGQWRLYVSVATPGTKHWRVDLLEAADLAGLSDAPARTVLAGDASVGVKDPVVTRTGSGWHLWASCHPLESWDEADRMSTWYATSPDGVEWTWRGPALGGRPGQWDARGVRVSSVLSNGDGVVVSYDGRATAEQNWEERTGVARGGVLADGSFGPLSSDDAPPIGSPWHPGGGLRYLSVVPLGAGRHRIYYEATRADGAHDLRTELLERPESE